MTWWVQPRAEGEHVLPSWSQFIHKIEILTYPLIAVIVALLGGIFSDHVTPLVLLGLLSLTLSLIAVWPNSTPLIKIIFAALASHAVIGLISAETSANATWVGSVGIRLYA